MKHDCTDLPESDMRNQHQSYGYEMEWAKALNSSNVLDFFKGWSTKNCDNSIPVRDKTWHRLAEVEGSQGEGHLKLWHLL